MTSWYKEQITELYKLWEGPGLSSTWHRKSLKDCRGSNYIFIGESFVENVVKGTLLFERVCKAPGKDNYGLKDCGCGCGGSDKKW